VSVVIPVYNGEQFIRAAVESALAQTPWVGEVIVVDDGSTDGTVSYAREFGEAVRIVELQHSGNPGVARNAGVTSAKGELIAFLDADDVWLPGKIEAQLEVIGANPTVGLVCTNAYRQTDPGQCSGMFPLLPMHAEQSGEVMDALLHENFIITSSVLTRRAELAAAGLFSVSEHLPAVEDYDLWLRVCSIVHVVYVDEPWLVYRDWGTSYRDEWSSVETARGVLRSLERLVEWNPSMGREHCRAMRARRASLHGEIASALWGLGDSSGARRSALTAVLQTPMTPQYWKRLVRMAFTRAR
jgi:glycosyltransferase involved in cell wall biosynthesis